MHDRHCIRWRFVVVANANDGQGVFFKSPWLALMMADRAYVLLFKNVVFLKYMFLNSYILNFAAHHMSALLLEPKPPAACTGAVYVLDWTGPRAREWNLSGIPRWSYATGPP
jgi:hypothetical protein